MDENTQKMKTTIVHGNQKDYPVNRNEKFQPIVLHKILLTPS